MKTMTVHQAASRLNEEMRGKKGFVGAVVRGVGTRFEFIDVQVTNEFEDEIDSHYMEYYVKKQQYEIHRSS